MKVLGFFVLISFFICSSLFAHSHAHGNGTLDISFEKDTIKSELRLPAVDVVGFEGPPSNPQQKKIAQNVRHTIVKEYNMYMIDESAGCVRQKPHYEEDHNEHGNYLIKLAYKCKDVSKVKSLDVNVFRDMESINALKVHVAVGKSKKNFDLTRTSTKIDLSGLN